MGVNVIKKGGMFLLRGRLKRQEKEIYCSQNSADAVLESDLIPQLSLHFSLLFGMSLLSTINNPISLFEVEIWTYSTVDLLCLLPLQPF